MNYYENVPVTCEDNGRVVDGEVVNFAPKEYMTVALNGMQLSMQWDSKLQEYRAGMSGLDFKADAPKQY
jgi:hypothetical protein